VLSQRIGKEITDEKGCLSVFDSTLTDGKELGYSLCSPEVEIGTV